MLMSVVASFCSVNLTGFLNAASEIFFTQSLKKVNL